MATAKMKVPAPRQAQPAGLEQLRAEARYAGERYHLYRAKMYGLRPTSMSRLRELERIYQGAESRLRRAQEQPAAAPQLDPAAPAREARPAAPQPATPEQT